MRDIAGGLRLATSAENDAPRACKQARGLAQVASLDDEWAASSRSSDRRRVTPSGLS
ncbi:hypothetical protein LF1_18700 [Rubripirellula obstinata]|uniref:Uncharacterized protein n=1 Tax=Rubripirellula obstinata TaxID=406547 RepID=A0A5B1CDX9_9BACT|nr:hypothetical protein LF1_18700 [Rubripirellula obstinata]